MYQYNDSTWGDLLTSYKGHTITYDEIGNPLSYYGRTSYTFTWEKGRQLVTAKTGGYTLSFEYNDQGIRTSKTVNGVKHTYSLEGSLIVSEEYGDYLLIYLYDETNSPYGIIRHNKADGTTSQYYLERDVFGNIIAIYNRSGTKVVSYCYDAWGNCTVVTNTDSIATMNPFRYRGYYLDVETNLYYLQTRYYDSYVGRFINADGQLNGGLLGNNQFAYCMNNPVMCVDFNGSCPHSFVDCVYCLAGLPYEGVPNSGPLPTSNNNMIPYKEKTASQSKPLKPSQYTISCTYTRSRTIFDRIDAINPNNDINTVQIGLTGSAGCGGYASASFGVAFDRTGDVGLYFSVGGGGALGHGAIIDLTCTTSNAPTIKNLKGLSFGMGGSVSFPVGPVSVGGGYDYSVSIYDGYRSKTYSIGAGVGYLPAEFHSQFYYTWVIGGH